MSCKEKRKSNGEQDDSLLSIPETPETAPIPDKDGDAQPSSRTNAVNPGAIRQNGVEKTESRPWLQGLLGFSKPKIVSKTTKHMKPHMPTAISSPDLPTQPAESLTKRYSLPSDDRDGSLALSQIHGSPLAVASNMSSPSHLGSSKPRSVSVKSTERPNAEIAAGNDEISSKGLRTECKDEIPAHKDILVMTRRDDSKTLEDKAEASEQHCSFGSSPTTPSKKPPPSYSYRNLISMALLASKNNRLTAAQIHLWVSSTFPCYIRGVGKWEGGIGAVLSQHKTFIKLPRGPSDDPKQGCYWTFAKDAKRGYENDPTLNYVPPVQDTSAHKVRLAGSTLHKKDQILKQNEGNPAEAVGVGRQWEQTARGIYRLVKSHATFEKHSELPKARTVYLRDGSYSIGDDVKYTHPESPSREALGRIKHIQLLPDGRCVFSLSRYIDRDEAKTLGCRNLREWPRQIKHIRRANPMAEEIADEAVKGHLSTKESNGISSTLYLSFQDDKCKVRVDPKTFSISTSSAPRRGVGWVDTSTDEETFKDVQTEYSRERLSRRRNKSIREHQQFSEGSDKVVERTALNEISRIRGGQQLVSREGSHESNDQANNHQARSPYDFTNFKLSSKPMARNEGSGDVHIPTVPHNRLQEDQTMERDLFAVFPDYAIDNVFWDKQKKIEEIKKRPSRKATFGKRLAFARTHRLNPHVELDGPRKPVVMPRRACSFYLALENRTTSPSKPVVHGNLESSQVSENLETVGTTQQFSSLEELLELPENPIPITYENQLAFREGILVSN